MPKPRRLRPPYKAMIVAPQPEATEAGLDILQAGGNALDAVIACALTQGVVDPMMCGVGGLGSLHLFDPESGQNLVFDGLSTCPSACRAEMWTKLFERECSDGYGYVLKGGVNELGHAAVTTPGIMGVFGEAHAAFGKLPFAELFGPAIGHAEHGWVVRPHVATMFGLDEAAYGRQPMLKKLAFTQDGRSLYLRPDGTPKRVGDSVRNPDLGATLRSLAREGAESFYTGELARRIVEDMRRHGGPMTLEDLANFKVQRRAPLKVGYRGRVVATPPPPGGGIMVAEMLRILEGFELADAGLSQSDRIHLHAEATKAAYRLRNILVADPDHHPLDIGAVLCDEAIAKLRAPISLDKAQELSAWDGPEHRDTIYLCVVDKDRNAISFINSLFAAFGSGIYAPKSGVLLQNRGTGFRVERGHRNAIAPRKRPLHTIIPGMLSRNGRAVMPFGVMGGQFQAAGHAHIVSRILDCGDDPQQASDYPRSFSIDGVLSLEPTIAESVRQDLEKRGHRTAIAPDPLGGCQAIWIDERRGVLFGGSDHRKDGMALGY